MNNPGLLQFFGESDSWWMDNLRRNVNTIEDEHARSVALVAGLHTGDYALSFSGETRELRLPLATAFQRIAARLAPGPGGHPHNRAYQLPVEEFVRQLRADLLFLSLPQPNAALAGSIAREEWRESWILSSPPSRAVGGAEPQSKRAYLVSIQQTLRAAAHFKSWAIEFQDLGLVSAQDVVELVRDLRPVKATYSKDVSEVSGGLRSYLIHAERPA